jgi:hypothetical protein
MWIVGRLLGRRCCDRTLAGTLVVLADHCVASLNSYMHIDVTATKPCTVPFGFLEIHYFCHELANPRSTSPGPSNNNGEDAEGSHVRLQELRSSRNVSWTVKSGHDRFP